MVEQQPGNEGTPQEDIGGGNPEVVALTKKDITEALEGKGPLRELIESVMQKAAEDGAVRETTDSLVLGSEDSKALLNAFGEKYPALGDALRDEEDFIVGVMSRAYLLMKWPAFESARMENLRRDRETFRRALNKAEEKDKETYKKAIQNIDQTIKLHEDAGRKIASASLEQSAETILGDLMSAADKDIDSEEAAKRIKVFNTRDIREKVGNPKEWLDAFVATFSKHHTGGKVKPRTSRAAAKKMAEEMKPIIDSLNNIDGSLKYEDKWKSFWRISPSRMGVSRALELATSYAETSANTVFLQGITASALGLSLVGNSPAQLAAWGLATAAGFGMITLQSLRAKGAMEKELTVHKMWKDALRAILKKHKAKLLAVGISSMAVNSAQVDALLTVEKAKKVQDEANIEEVIEKIEDEIAQIAGPVDTRSYPLRILGSLGINVLGSIDNAPRKGADDVSVMERVESMPEDLRHRMETFIKAEAGIEEAVAEARRWGVPLSGEPGIGPRVIALGQLMGYSVAEIEALTGMRSEVAMERATPEIEELRIQLKFFAKNNGLEDYLDEDAMENPLAVLDALAEQFDFESSAAVDSFLAAGGNFIEAVNSISNANTATTMAETLLQFSGGVRPEDLREYSSALQQEAADVTEEYNIYAAKLSELSRILGTGVKNVYVANDRRAQSIDVNSISLTPESLELDFTQVNTLVTDVEEAMQTMLAADDIDSLSSGEGVMSREEFDREIQEAESRLNSVIDFVTKRKEWEEIMLFRHGNLAQGELDSKIRAGGALSWASSLGIVLFVFSTLTLSMVSRQRKTYRELGEGNRENMLHAEGQIADLLRKTVNRFIQENRRIANVNKEQGLEVQFPHELVSNAEVKRALRTVADEHYIHKNWLEKLMARSAYTPNMDEVKDYSDSLFDLQKPQQLMRVLDVLLPGWDISIHHMRQLKEGKSVSGDLGASRSWEKHSLSPKSNMFASEIAVRTVQNEQLEFDIAMHRAFLQAFDKETSGKGKGKKKKEGIFDSINILRGRGALELPEQRWLELYAAAQDGSVRAQIQESIKDSEARVNKNTARINTIYSRIIRNPVQGKAIDRSFENTFTSRSGRVGRLGGNMFGIRGHSSTQRAIEEQVKYYLKVYRGERERERAFDPNEGYFEELFKKANEYAGDRPEKDTPLDAKTKERLDKRIAAVTSVVESTRGSFQRAINKEFFGSYKVDMAPVTTFGDGEGVVTEIEVRSEDQKGAPVIARETVQISDILMGAADKNKNIEDNIARNLVGGNLVEAVKKGSYQFKPGEHNKDKKLLNAYNRVWEALHTASEGQEIPKRRDSLKARAQESIRRSIPVSLIAPGLVQGDAAGEVREGMSDYLAHLRAQRVLDALKRRGNTAAELDDIEELFKPTSERIVSSDNVTQRKHLSYTERLYKLYQNADTQPAVEVVFDYMKQRFSVRGTGMLRSLTGRSYDSRGMETYLQKFIPDERARLQKNADERKSDITAESTPQQNAPTTSAATGGAPQGSSDPATGGTNDAT